MLRLQPCKNFSTESNKVMPRLLTQGNCEIINVHCFKLLNWLIFFAQQWLNYIGCIIIWICYYLLIDSCFFEFWGEAESWIGKNLDFVECYNHWFNVYFTFILNCLHSFNHNLHSHFPLTDGQPFKWIWCVSIFVRLYFCCVYMHWNLLRCCWGIDFFFQPELYFYNWSILFVVLASI